METHSGHTRIAGAKQFGMSDPTPNQHHKQCPRCGIVWWVRKGREHYRLCWDCRVVAPTWGLTS